MKNWIVDSDSGCRVRDSSSPGKEFDDTDEDETNENETNETDDGESLGPRVFEAMPAPAKVVGPADHCSFKSEIHRGDLE